MRLLSNPRLDSRQTSLYGDGHRQELLANNPHEEVKWVRQEHAFGCVLACVAMVLGKSYAEVHSSLAPHIWGSNRNADDEFCWKQGHNFDERGWYFDDAYRWLEEQGYATQMKYRVQWGHVEREIWPPKPFAPIHMVYTMTHADTQHAVVMTRTGKVLDPAKEPGSWDGGWGVYKSVNHVCGIWKVGVI